jgi:hypothetical protein
MKALRHLLQRPVAFHPAFVDLTGSVTSALFLSQACYWTEIKDGGWFYKTMKDWESEIKLSRFEQESARKKLIKLGFLEEQRRGCPAKLYFRVNFEAIEVALEELPVGEPDSEKLAIQNANDSQTRMLETSNLKELETTTETTPFSLLSEPSRNGPRKHKKANGSDPRHSEFKALIVRCYKYLNEEDPPWDTSDAAQLKALIAAKPDLTKEKFHTWLINYAESRDINPPDRPRKFIPRLPSYASGPLNQYGRPLEESRA